MGEPDNSGWLPKAETRGGRRRGGFKLEIQFPRPSELWMRDPHRWKHWLFRNYLFVSVLGFAIFVLLFVFGPLEWEVLKVCVAGIGVFAFGVQKQHVEEVRLFRELFKEFNERYDKQNEKLNRIYCEKLPDSTPFDSDQIDTLYNYFNLCGEEYLYFQKGFIYSETWQSWKNGMKFFRQNPRIKKLWDEELRNGSYYGLTFDDQDMQAVDRCNCMDTKHATGEA